MSTLLKSSIQRSWPATFGFLFAGLAFAGIGYAVFRYTDGGPWLGAFAVAMFIVAIILWVIAVTSAGSCACPTCGKEISGLGTGKNDGAHCSACHGYFEGTGGQLWATDPARVADRAQFASPLPETFTFPDGCCVCGKPETHRVKVSVVTQGGGDVALAATTGIRSSTRTSVEVPHCDEHKDGASLTGTKGRLKIQFRSYPYLRAFCALNNTTPG